MLSHGEFAGSYPQRRMKKRNTGVDRCAFEGECATFAITVLTPREIFNQPTPFHKYINHFFERSCLISPTPDLAEVITRKTSRRYILKDSQNGTFIRCIGDDFSLDDSSANCTLIIRRFTIR